MKSVITHIAAMYLGAGLFGGMVMQSAVPSMNTFGVAAYAASWPAFLYCARSSLEDCDPFAHIPMRMQAHMFNLDLKP